MKKRVLLVVLAFVMAAMVAMTACEVATPQASSAENAAEGTKEFAGQEIEVMEFVNSTTDAFDDAILDMVDAFTEETGIKVSFSAPGEGYEELMKARMAANDLPDVFSTHGWAVVRYGEYLLPLNDQAWEPNVSDIIRGVVTNANGELMVLPIVAELSGIDCNYDVLEEAGVDPAVLRTWADFEDACEKVKAIGKTPICMGAKDSWMPAQVLQDLCPSGLEEYEGAIADGSFDWNALGPILEKFADWVSRGFFNIDCLTADYNTCCEMLGNGDGAFVLSSQGAIRQANSYHPDANLGFIPVPSFKAEDTPIGVVGEYLTFGIWKDSKNQDAAKEFLAYLARPENSKILSEALNQSCGLSNVKPDLGALTKDYENLGQFRTKPVWDRTLPSGMWNDLCTISISVMAQEPDAIQKSIDLMQNSYDEKMK